ncbi:MAG: C10 family peptidase [Bacteroidales bacterium]|nr:C10 family peptidase [Bacteroidales bacterium]
MRITLSILGAIAGLITCQAATITPNQALERAQKFMSRPSAAHRAPVAGAKSLALAYTATDAAGEADFFVFNQAAEAGYVIVAGDDAITPVIGYADAGKFDPANMPANMKWWLSEMQREIEFIKKNPDQARKAPVTTKAVAPLLTCTWNQDGPFNNLCPTYSGDTRCATGCAATATAQIMYHHKYPAQGTGSHSYTTRTKKFELSVDFSQSVYNWAAMKDVYSYSTPEAAKEAVARLMYDVGVALDMDYSYSSAALNTDVVNALPTYFGYDKSIQYHIRDAYSVAMWEKLLRDELDAGRPVYYSGQANTGGHAFVCDGYDKEGYFHFNWGWGGNSDGYFMITMLNPKDQGIGSFDGGYNTAQAMITHIMPDQGGVAPAPTGSIGTATFRTNVTSAPVGSAPGFYLSNITMSGAKDWNESLIWGATFTTPTLDNPEMKTQQWLTNAKDITPGVGYSFESPIPIGVFDLPDGKYFLRLYYKKDDGAFEFFTGMSPRQYVICCEFVNGYVFFSPYNLDASLEATNLTLWGDTLYTNNKCEVACQIKNNGTEEYCDNINVALMQGTTVKQKGNDFKLGIAPGKFSNFNVEFQPTVEAGEYVLAILDADGTVIGSKPVVIEDAGAAPNVTVRVSVAPDEYEMPSNAIKASAMIRNSGGTFMGKMGLYIMSDSETGEFNFHKTLYSDVVTVKNGETAWVYFKGEFAGEPGETYWMSLKHPKRAEPWGAIVSFTVKAPERIPGDITGDGNVDVSDVTALVDKVLGSTKYPDEICDIDGNGDIDVSDITTLIGMILN